MIVLKQRVVMIFNLSLDVNDQQGQNAEAKTLALLTKIVFLGVLFFAVMLYASGAQAQALPNAGSIERNIEEGFKAFPFPKQNTLKPTPAPQTEAVPQGVTVVVREFIFSGNQLIGQAELQNVLSEFLNKPITYDQLKQATQAIDAYYRGTGWVVNSYLPRQDITNGQVMIQVVEAQFGKVILSEDQTSQVKSELLAGIVNSAQSPGAPLSVGQIDRALLLLDDLPGVSVIGNFTPGEQQGQTDLTLQVLNEPRVTGNMVIDNTGSVSTGASRVFLTGYLNSPLNRADLLTANVLKSEGTNYGRLSYTVLMNSYGLRAGVHGSSMNYKLVGAFQSLNSKGTAFATGWDLTYPWVRSQSSNLNIIASSDHKWFSNDANQSTTSKYALNVTSLSLSGNRSDDFAGGGAMGLNLGWSQGRVDLTDSPNQLPDAMSANTNGPFSKASLSLYRQQTLSKNLSLWLSLNAQKANKNLDSSEKIYLGGVNGVRAYPSNEAGGSNGGVAVVELRDKLDANFTLTAFYDYGNVTVYQNNFDANLRALTPLNSFALKGGGLSLEWQNFKGVSLKVSVAKRVLSNPNANASTGADSDGTLRFNRVWLNSTFSF
jgi:hemolysin activation/secretion protein